MMIKRNFMFIIFMENTSNKIQQRNKVNKVKLFLLGHVSSHVKQSSKFVNKTKQIMISIYLQNKPKTKVKI